MDFSTFAKLSRFKDIISTLLKYGLDEAVQRLNFPGAKLIKRIHPVEREMGIYERIRCVLEDLGPTFVKFGQIMSLRPDLLPSELLFELSKLQDEVPPVETSKIRTVVEKSLGQSIENVFSVFDNEPIAAASISQVHRAVLRKEGSIVVAKVQRPGIRKKIQADLDILESVADRLHENSDDLRTYDLPNLVSVVRRNLIREIDFRIEAQNLRIARSFALQTDVYIPEVHHEYCSEQMLVMEYVQGEKIKDIDPGDEFDAQGLAKQGLNAAIKQILEDGFFNADPHPGNLLVTADMQLCIIDWGMVGHLTERDRYELIDLLKSVVDKDSDALVHVLLRLSKFDGEVIEYRALERELLYILNTYFAVPIRDVNIGQLLMAIVTLLRNYHLHLPPDLVIMVKALVTAEGTARLVYPELDVVSEAKSYVSRLAEQRFKPENLWRSFQTTFSSIWTSQRDIPRQLLHILSKLESGELGLHFHLDKLERLVNTLENSSNRLTTGIIVAALIMGSSMIITTGVGPFIFGFPVLGVIGYLISTVMGLWLVITILRAKKY
ncbi:MAG: AarF/UbiB family protein [Desulfobacterales bacterium]